MDEPDWLSSLPATLRRPENGRLDGQIMLVYRWALSFFQRKNPYELPAPLSPRGEALLALEAGTAENVDPQVESIFFNLPRELRDMIYPMLFEGTTVHVERVDGRLRTRYIDDLLQSTRCDEEKVGCLVKRTFQPLNGVTSPLKTCRKFYTEAIDALYPRITFAFQDIMSLCCFLGSIHSSRHRVIHALQLSFALVALPGYRLQEPGDGYYDAWTFASHGIRAIPNLREFQIVDGEEYYADEDDSNRMVYLTDAEGYVPILGWPKHGSDLRGGNQPTVPLKLVSG